MSRPESIEVNPANEHATVVQKDIATELNDFKEKYGVIEPNRGDLDDKSIKWRTGKPNYNKANLEFFKGKTMNHTADSLEKIVEDLVKTWEMEASHKIELSQWTSIDNASYSICANGGKVFNDEDAKTLGNYNTLMYSCPKHLYDSTNETFETSHHLFRSTFPDGFAWELLKVFSGPPKVTFTWRHWGRFTGSYKENIGSGEIVELYGFCMVTVSDALKVQNIEVFYAPASFLEALEGKRPIGDLKRGQAFVGTGCAFFKEIKN